VQQTRVGRILPILLAVTACLVIAWLVFWLLSRSIRRFVNGRPADEPPAAVERWVNQLSKSLKKAISVAALITSILILSYGVGVEGLPRLTWDRIAQWLKNYVVSTAFIFGSGYVVIQFFNLSIDRLPAYFARSAGSFAAKAERRKRAEAAGRLLRWVSTAVVLAIATLMALRSVGVDVTPLLTGSAVFGVALGFGAQDLVKDIISGFFLIIENQIRVGDVVEVNGKTGLVEDLRIRTIVVRGIDGTAHTIPNGTIRQVSNRTKEFSYYVIDVRVAYKENVDFVMDTLRELGRELESDARFAPKILEPLEVLGVDDFTESSVLIKSRIRTVPLEQWTVGRELRRRIKNVFDERRIEIR
jgi:small-conductance mechanosensitive channel